MLELPSNDSTREFLKYYTSESHLAGSAADKRQAEWTRDKFIEFGIADTKIETYYTLINHPIKRRVALISGPEALRYEALLYEPPIDEDETSKYPNVTPSYHGYSKNGSVTGQVVYANYGRPEDFDYLAKQGIKLNGTIALVRYGGEMHRGLKVRAAEMYGCIGALIYSDPMEDGPAGKTDQNGNPAKAYPDGLWRPENSVERGTVSYASIITGDPTTPGYASTKDSPRIRKEDSPGLPSIPSLPLSYGDALPLLRATQGHGIRGGKDWIGGLKDVDYFSGPTQGNAILVNIVDYSITPIWDTIGVIKGEQEPDKAIILGNHRDAWVYGANDPSSGSACLIELARVFGELLKTGWRPARTIILASWDQEEFGLVGSTEWVEDNRDWLSKEGVAYINVDAAIIGTPNLIAQATPLFNQLLYDVTKQVLDPRTKKTVYEAWGEYTNRTIKPTAQPSIGQLAAASDFCPFFEHLGIPSMLISFIGDNGVYHSVYDSFHWVEKFGDPNFHYHKTMVKIWGLLALRLADSTILPLHPGDYASSLKQYAHQIEERAFKSEITRNDKNSADTFSFPNLNRAIQEFSTVANKFEKYRNELEVHVQHRDGLDDDDSSLLYDLLPSSKLSDKIAIINDCLAYFERKFLDPEGISKKRAWFKHIVFAPKIWTGYSAQIFPKISDALDEGDKELIEYAEQKTASCIEDASNSLKMFDDTTSPSSDNPLSSILDLLL
ncbi:hypothetical protein BDA99DRAFT_483807 [Phascolomyces articulosus]|uniref:Uncharacterized protein n=1 Tax=Phascolomyces articulosus TaxID=60185 RepID=A0AAD5K6Q8_9FUNG|nr:hypothetical protein BDA99DRAFT_483807 [Phascolomyces articulosus]